MPLVTVKDATFSYENTLVSQLNFEVNHGDYVCISGENGVGKTTLLKCMLHLKPLSSGCIKYEQGFKPTQTGYLPQQTQLQQGFHASVFEVVLSGRLNKQGLRPFYSAADKEIAHKNIARVGLSAYMQKNYGTLSGGLQQRALIARALCATHVLLFLDEPVAGLDSASAQGVYEILAQINDALNITIIMVSHDITSALQYATHILSLQDGKGDYRTVQEYKNNILSKQLSAKENINV